jgi:hypothetical protein
MQQYSSLPEQNSQVDATPTLLSTVEQLRAQLWLETSLNKLQNRLNDCLYSALDTSKQFTNPEAEIFQALVTELNAALNTSKMALALPQPQETVCICYICSSLPQAQPTFVSVMSKGGEKLRLKLKEAVRLEDLRHLEQQQPQSAWSIATPETDVMGWIVTTKAPLCSSCESKKDFCIQFCSQLFTSAAQCCAIALVRLRKIQALQEHTQELERTNQLKNQFLANTSHEIRTPLSSMLGFTHLLLAQGYDPAKERHQEYLSIILSSGKHLLALINDILDLSKIEANQLEVQCERVYIPELCRNVLALVKEKAGNRNLKLHLDLDSNVQDLVVDPLRLKQMLLNLLFNALKFTTIGTVGLKVYPQDQFLHFVVWDTGTGISKEDQVHLFQPYFQISNPVVSRDEGTGLGLAVTRKLAEIHGGRVDVESEINQGSRFTIVLPITIANQIEEDKLEDDNIQSTQNLQIDPLHLEILLVENDIPNGQMIQTYLDRLGYQVTWVKNQGEMWEVLKGINPVLILMDIQLTDGNGLELVQQLRQEEKYKLIPVIAQTAMAMKGDRETCLAGGFNDYISKPIDLPLLATLVGKYLRCRGAGY